MSDSVRVNFSVGIAAGTPHARHAPAMGHQSPQKRSAVTTRKQRLHVERVDPKVSHGESLDDPLPR